MERSCSSNRAAGIRISYEVGTASLALFTTVFASSADSRRASASQNSTESGMTSTAQARSIWASQTEDSRLMIPFHRRTELGCVRARTRFLAMMSCSSSAARSQILTLCPTCWAGLARTTFASLSAYPNISNEEEEKKMKLTWSLTASNHTSSLFGHCSHPCLIIFLAATILPAWSSRQAAAIHPRVCFGLDLTRDSNSILARSISPIWTSDLKQYPFGPTEADMPFVVVPEIWGEVRRSARRMRREIPGLVSERGSCRELDRFRQSW